MKTKKLLIAIGLAMFVAAGCAGMATFKRMSKDQQTVLFKDMQTNYANYRLHQCPGILVYEPKSDEKAIKMTGEGCRTVEELTDSNIVKKIELRGYQSLHGKNKELYGFIFWNSSHYSVGAKEIDNNTLHVWYVKREWGGPL